MVLWPKDCKYIRSFFSCLEVFRLVQVLGPVVQEASAVFRVTCFMMLHWGWNILLHCSLEDLLGVDVHYLLPCSCCLNWSRCLYMVIWWVLKFLVQGLVVQDVQVLFSIILACPQSQFAISTIFRVLFGRVQDILPYWRPNWILVIGIQLREAISEKSYNVRQSGQYPV